MLQEESAAIQKYHYSHPAAFRPQGQHLSTMLNH